MFEKAIEIDPGYALAYAGIATACSLLYTYFDGREVNLRFRPTSPAARRSSSRPNWRRPTWRAPSRCGTVTMQKRASRNSRRRSGSTRNCSTLSIFTGAIRKYQGRYAEAVKLLERASQLQPEDFQAPAFLGGSYAGMGMRAEASAARRRAVKLIEQRLDLNPDNVRAYNLGATTLAKLGNVPRALEFARKSLSIEPEDPLVLYNVACLHALIDMREEALGYLERAVKNGFGHMESMANDPDLDSIRKTPWFQAIAQAMATELTAHERRSSYSGGIFHAS